MENPCGHIASQMVACPRIGIKSLKNIGFPDENRDLLLYRGFDSCL